MKFYTNVACQDDHIYYRGVEDGRRIHRKKVYSPTLFIPASPASTPTGWKDLQGNPVDEISFPSIAKCREYLKKYEDVFSIFGNTNYEFRFIADEHPEELLEYDASQIVTAFIDIEVDTEFGMPIVDTAKNPVTAITLKFSNDPKYYAFGCKSFTPHRPDVMYIHCTSEVELLTCFMELWSEKSPDIVTGWNVKTFDIPYLVNRMIAMSEFGESRTRWLSPWGKISLREEKNPYGKPVVTYELLGISTLDYLQLYRKYGEKTKQESYKLDHIAHVELKERKLDYSEYETLHHLYRDNFQKFIEYNIKDVELVERLEAKGGLIGLAIILAYNNKTNYDAAFFQVRMWEAICYNFLRREHVVIPPKKREEKKQAYEGAYVKAPLVGFWRWVMGLDLTSLYPHLIMQYNLSPETLIEPDQYTDAMKDVMSQGITVKKMLAHEMDLSGLKDCTVTPNGQFFTTTRQGFLPKIMQLMFESRVIYKNKQLAAEKEKETCTDPERKKVLDGLISRYGNLQLAKKTGLNSAYGAMGSEYFRFFDIRIAEGVTLAGQLSIRWIGNWLNTYLNDILGNKTKDQDYVIASDTDSVYLNLEPLVKTVFKDTSDVQRVINFMDQVYRTKLKGVLEVGYQKLAEYTHAYAQKMSMKREALADKGIWTAKKRYILNVWDSEGVRYREAKMLIHGLEAIKSSTPSACRDKIKDALKIMLNGTEAELIAFVDKFRIEFRGLPLTDVAFPRGCNGLEKYAAKSVVLEDDDPLHMFCGEGDVLPTAIYITKTPIHVKGALVYNYWLRRLKLDTQYDFIQPGEKVKFLHLKPRNPFEDEVIAFVRRIPAEFELEKYVDYDVQFQKSFLEPLEIVLKCIGWRSEESSTLEGLF